MNSKHYAIIINILIIVWCYFWYTADRLFPVLLLIGIITYALILLTGIPIKGTVVLSSIILFSSGFKLLIFTFPASIVGIDTFGYAEQIFLIVQSGGISAMTQNFYNSIPAFHILAAEFSIVTDLPPEDSLLIYPIIFGIIGSLISYSLILHYLKDRLPFETVEKISLAGAGVSILLPTLNKMAYWPIAQTLAVMLFYIICYILLKYGISKRSLFLFLILILSISLTHKIPLAIVSFALLTTPVALIAIHSISASELISRVKWDRLSKNLILLGTLSGIALFIQWEYATEFFNFGILNLANIIITDLSNPTITLPDGIAAHKPNQPFWNLTSYRYRGTFSLLVLFAASWIFFVFVHKREKLSFLLALSSSVSLLYLLGFILPSFSRLGRIFPFIEILALVVIFTGIGEIVRFKSKISVPISSLVVVLILVFQAFSAPALPDYSSSPRFYLTSGEMSGYQFADRYGSGQIAADTYYSTREIRINDAYTSSLFTTSQEFFLTGKVNRIKQDSILIRETENIYWMGKKGRWKLEYNPSEKLNRRWNRIYDTGETSAYEKG